eukprot:TRINITY_DN30003_c0_g1_i1.p1 TRINITY_DN30003_c0_g1~~TRINITY_DN30003_c0_g1_i1.p1  ORF type:complete len:439 (+),score=79.62 TRINITY_DN30003_c0_g1_i1:74-1390(+)
MAASESIVSVTLLSDGQCIGCRQLRVEPGNTVGDVCARALLAQCDYVEVSGNSEDSWSRCPSLSASAETLVQCFGGGSFRIALQPPPVRSRKQQSNSAVWAVVAVLSAILALQLGSAARRRFARCPPCFGTIGTGVDASGEEEARLRQVAAATKATKFSTDWRHTAALHEYEGLYARRLGPMRGVERMLEIGAGCESGVAGRSYEFWRQWLRPGKLFTMDLRTLRDDCLRWWHGTAVSAGFIDADPAFYGAKTYADNAMWGDQGNVSWLQEQAEEMGSLDVVVDDGSHRADHQRLAFEVLFPILRPGGVYVVEDIEANFIPLHSPSQIVRDADTFPDYVARMLYDMHVPYYRGKRAVFKSSHRQNNLTDQVSSIECARYACVIQKRSDAGFHAKMMHRSPGQSSFMDSLGSTSYKARHWPCRVACDDKHTGEGLCRCH